MCYGFVCDAVDLFNSVFSTDTLVLVTFSKISVPLQSCSCVKEFILKEGILLCNYRNGSEWADNFSSQIWHFSMRNVSLASLHVLVLHITLIFWLKGGFEVLIFRLFECNRD
jgi:hypothetical protein